VAAGRFDRAGNPTVPSFGGLAADRRQSGLYALRFDQFDPDSWYVIKAIMVNEFTEGTDSKTLLIVDDVTGPAFDGIPTIRFRSLQGRATDTDFAVEVSRFRVG
jgi:hypothetical protein